MGVMPVFKVLVPAAGLYLCLLSLFKFKRLMNPVLIIVSWWALWLLISNFSLTGFFVPSGRTQVMVLVMLGSMSLGSLLAFGRDREPARTAAANAQFARNGRYLFWLNLLLAPVMGLLMYRAIPALLASEPGLYRTEVFGTSDGPSPLFGGGSAQFLFFSIVSPVVFFSLIAGAAYFFKSKSRKLLLISLVLMVIEGIVMLGRFNFYYILAIIAFAYIFLGQRKAPAPRTGLERPAATTRVKLKVIKFGVGTAMILALLLGLSIVRGEKNIGPLATLKKIAVDYHTVGLVLFDQELIRPSSRLNSGMSYGRSLIGGFDTLVVVMLRRFNPDLVPVAGESGAYMAVPRVVGTDERGKPIMGNAFYTVLYTLYYDGRYLAVILIPLIFGYFLAASYLDWLKNGSLASLVMLVLLMYVGLFSLFQSPIESLRFWGALILLALLKHLNLTFLVPSPAAPET
jgi:oligosaccharide repeat unit polymerase